MKKYFFILFTAISLVSLTLDEDPILLLVEAFERYNDTNPVEKVYVHTDKPYYTAGESVWFKAYATMGTLELPDTLSVPLYVEIIDSQAGKVIDNRILRMIYGFANGDFKLADTLRPGFYQLRAYTNWMKNTGEAAYFIKDFQVFEPGKGAVPVATDQQKIAFQFFPEGGDLVSGVNGRLAFKATDASGKGIDNVKGYIVNAAKDTVAQFESRHMGMGYTNFTPDATQTYDTRIVFNNIVEQEVMLPKIKPSGYALTVDNLSSPQSVKVFIHKTPDLDAVPVAIVAQSKGKVYFLGKILTKRSVSYVEIPKIDLPGGVIQLTLIDEMGRPRCERLVFNKMQESIQPKFTTEKKYYATREKVTVDLNVNDSDGKPIEGSFSVVVSDARQVKTKPDAETIYTYFTLSSEVNGRIEQPQQYVDEKNNFAPVNLDLLLMTQGWRRFTWQDLADKRLNEPKHLAEKGLQISGEITRSDGKSLSKAIEVSLMTKSADDQVNFMVANADDNGMYLFRDLYIQDSVRVLLQAVAGKNRRNTSIFVDSLASPKIKIVGIPFNIIEFENEDLAEYLRRTQEALALEQKIRMDKSILLEEVVVRKKREDDINNAGTLYRNPDASLQVGGNNALIGFVSVFDLIRGRFAGVNVSGDSFNPSVTIRGISSINSSSEPLFLLDGMPVDKSVIGSIPVNDVDKIDILKGASAAIYGSRGGNGVISVLTKRGGENYDWKTEAAPGIITFTKPGYYTARQFYSPDYTQDTPENLRPDFRSTVLWQPMLQTDASGKASFTFYTTDASTLLDVRLEGLSFTGRPIVGNYQFEVR